MSFHSPTFNAYPAVSIRIMSRSVARRIVVPPSSVPEPVRDWKRHYLRRPGNDWLCDIPDDYIADRFNLHGLNEQCPRYFNLCCDIILGKAEVDRSQTSRADEILQTLPKVYGLIHQRYIMSPGGLKDVADKYWRGVYGTCPRLRCEESRLLPIGLTLRLDKELVKGFCPCCRQVYSVPDQKLDGAYFGPNMCHIFVDQNHLKREHEKYVPFEHKAFGFRVRDNSLVQ